MTRVVKGIQVRKITAEDTEALVTFGESLFGHSIFVDGWRDAVQKCLTGYFPPVSQIAVVDETIVGALIGEIRGWEFGSPLEAWARWFVVAPEYRGKSVGRKLLAAFIEECRSLGIRSIHAMIGRKDKRLQKFLHLVGFRRGDQIELAIKR